MWGADVAELRTLAHHFGKASNSLLQQSTQLGNQIDNNPSWKGQDAVVFRSDWNGTHKAMLQQAASALKQESRKLLENANEQEKASNGAPGSGGGPVPGGSGGPGGSGSGSKENPLGPDWLAKGSPFRDAWGLRGQFKAGFDLPKSVFGLAVLGRQGAEVLKDAAAWKYLPARSVTYNLLDSGSDLLGAKNLFKYFPPLSDFRSVFEEAPLFFKGQGPVLEALGKGGLGRGVGWLGVGLNGLDTAKYIAEGKTGEIFARKAVESAAFVAETGKNLADMGKSAANFLGIG